MAIQVTVEKTVTGPVFTGEKWTNVYHFNVSDADTALSRGVAVGVLEMLVSYEDVLVSKVSTYVAGDPSQTRIATPGSVGVLDGTGLGPVVPLFNTVRVVFTDGEGRSEMKYLRTMARADNMGNGVWDGEYVTLVQASYADAAVALEGFCGPNDQEVTDGLVIAAIQMRQLGWSRRPRPGFKRGWVPV